MAGSKFMSFIDFAKGFYKQGLDMIEPNNDEFTILSGCLLLVIGLEKLLKHALEATNPLLTLENIKHTDVLDLHNGKAFDRKQVICLNAAYSRLKDMHPVLGQEKAHFDVMKNERDFLVHQTGYFDITKIESRVRLNLAHISESVCADCLGTTPDAVFGKELWDRIAGYRETHRLELQKRVDYFKRLHSQNQPLPCEKIELATSTEKQEADCPVCGGVALLEQDVAADSDGEPYPYPSAFLCANCGFSLSDANEIEEVVGRDIVDEFLYGPPYDDLEENWSC